MTFNLFVNQINMASDLYLVWRDTNEAGWVQPKGNTRVDRGNAGLGVYKNANKRPLWIRAVIWQVASTENLTQSGSRKSFTLNIKTGEEIFQSDDGQQVNGDLIEFEGDMYKLRNVSYDFLVPAWEGQMIGLGRADTYRETNNLILE